MHVIVGLPSLTFNFWHGKPVFWCAFVWFLVALLATNIFPFKVVGKMTLTNNSLIIAWCWCPTERQKGEPVSNTFHDVPQSSWSLGCGNFSIPVTWMNWLHPMEGCLTPSEPKFAMIHRSKCWFWCIFQTSIFSAGTANDSVALGGMKILPDSRKLNADETFGSLDICRKTSKSTESFKEFHHAKTLFYQDSYKHRVYDMKGCIFGWNMMKSQHSAIRYGQNDSLFHLVSILVVFDTNILPL